MKKCANGHYYNEALGACPYCSDDNNFDDIDATQIPMDDFDATSGFNDESPTMPVKNSETPATEIFGGDVPKTKPFGTGDDPLGNYQSNNNDNERTIIIDSSDDNIETEKTTRQNRKLVGWLVSYTLDEMGMDYRLYEGRNIIGSKPDVDVPVLQDDTVSGNHATILYRNNKFLLKDELSTNGTFLNGKIVEIDTPEIKDGDIIKTGNTVFKFKVAL